MNRTDKSGPFILMTNFPKRVFTENDFDTPLEVLGKLKTHSFRNIENYVFKYILFPHNFSYSVSKCDVKFYF